MKRPCVDAETPRDLGEVYQCVLYGKQFVIPETLTAVHTLSGQLDSSHACCLLTALTTPNNVTLLNLSRNFNALAGIYEMALLSDILKDKSSKITFLDLTSTGITNEGMVILAKGLSENTSLRTLLIGDTASPKPVLDCLCTSNKTLAQLAVTHVESEAVSELLSKNSSISCLTLSANFGALEYSRFSEALQNSKTLTSLSIFSENSSTGKVLLSALFKNTVLTSLRLTCFKLTGEDVATLIRENRSLKNITILKTRFTRNEQDEIMKQMCFNEVLTNFFVDIFSVVKNILKKQLLECNKGTQN